MQDVQWSDIDYMKLHLDWTYDDVNFHGLPDIVNDLHNHSQKYVVIVVSLVVHSVSILCFIHRNTWSSWSVLLSSVHSLYSISFALVMFLIFLITRSLLVALRCFTQLST